MSTSEQPDIDEAVWLLSDLAPDELRKLRDIAPREMLPHLEKGGTAGPAAENEFKLRILALISGLSAAKEDALFKAQKLMTMSKQSRLFRLGNAILNIICTSALAATLLEGSFVWSIVFGVLLIASNVCIPLSDYRLFPDSCG